MLLTDYNYAEVLPKLSTIQLMDMVEDMPAKSWMQKEIQRRIAKQPYHLDGFYKYLNLCHEMWVRKQERDALNRKRYRYCS